MVSKVFVLPNRGVCELRSQSPCFKLTGPVLKYLNGLSSKFYLMNQQICLTQCCLSWLPNSTERKYTYGLPAGVFIITKTTLS